MCRYDYRSNKASELVPCSLLPHWNSMHFSRRFPSTTSTLNGTATLAVATVVLCKYETHVAGWRNLDAVVLSAFRCVHPENQTKIFDFNIFMNQNKRRLHKT